MKFRVPIQFNAFTGILFLVSIYIVGSVLAVLSDTYTSENTDTLWYWVISISMIWWTFEDKKLRDYPVSFDFGYYIFTAWLLILPVYLIQTRGKSAILGIIAIITLYLLPWAFWTVVDTYVW